MLAISSERGFLRLLFVPCLLVIALFAPSPGEAASPPRALDRFAPLDAVVERAVARGEIPGAVFVIGHDGKVVHRKAFGWRSLEPSRERMTQDTIFDMASLTKSMATAPAVMSPA